MGTPAAVGLGSNLGDRRSNLDRAVAALSATPGLSVVGVSPYRETPPVGGPGGQGAFLNAAAAVETDLEPGPLLSALHGIEAAAGRVRAERWGERTLDLDLLLYGNVVVDSPRLRLPHPRMGVRRFALAPLAEVAPGAVEPRTGRTVADLLANLDRRPSHVAVLGAEGPFTSAVFRGVVEGLGARVLGAEAADPGGTADPDPGGRWLASRLDPSANSPAVGWSPAPTFLVVLGGESDPGPGHRHVPGLWFEARDPGAVVADVLAACAATRAG